ncbi:MAG: hypothetical protein ACPLXC_01315 [Candidatus Pacearchaeota archaeon]
MKYKGGREKRRKYVKGVEREVIAWIIALLVLAFIIFGIIILQNQGFNLIDKLKEFLRFGR